MKKKYRKYWKADTDSSNKIIQGQRHSIDLRRKRLLICTTENKPFVLQKPPSSLHHITDFLKKNKLLYKKRFKMKKEKITMNPFIDCLSKLSQVKGLLNLLKREVGGT
ncbi:MAG: hypothetical protein ABSA75_12840 [Candidatus Bathyarchaeia archaeon]